MNARRFRQLMREENDLVEAEKAAWRRVETAVLDATGKPLSHDDHKPLRDSIRGWMLARDEKVEHRKRSHVEMLACGFLAHAR